MTDSMKFGPEWLRNMSAEPLGSTNNVSVSSGSGNGIVGNVGTNNSLSIHTIGIGHSSSGGNCSFSTSRNMFPEYRYGREEMLSLFERNCVLPQIIPTFKKLYIEKVQYPLALTPSSEDEVNSQTASGNCSRPAWLLQRPTGGFSAVSRGSGRGSTADRGRVRGKSIYHPIYQRPNTLYDDGISPILLKSERNWSERNGTGDSAAVGPPTSGTGGDWNGTPNSSPRKEFSSHHRNMENWRRNRNEDGSGDGPGTASASGTEGWRSGGSVNGGFANNSHRWGRSTSWRDEEPLVGNVECAGLSNSTNIQRSFSSIGTVAPERSGNSKAPGVGAAVSMSRQIVTKTNHSWSGSNLRSMDNEDNLPEWAMENPSELGGTFDSSGAFHGESDDEINKHKSKAQEKTDIVESKESSDIDITLDKTLSETTKNITPSSDISNIDRKESTDVHAKGLSNKNDTKPKDSESNSLELSSAIVAAPKSEILGDISERFKEVANEVEKLIMDDDSGIANQVGCITESLIPVSTGMVSSQYVMHSLTSVNSKPSSELDSNRQQQILKTAVTTTVLADIAHKPIPFSDQLTIQHHLHHQQRQHLSATSLPQHVINTNPNDLWFYRDPQSNVQGPFSAIEMTEWYRAGYFNENLFVRRFSDSRFRPLGELIKVCHGNMPFHSHLMPSPADLDNLQVNPGKPTPLSLSDHQQHDDQLKANVTAAADSLSAAVKGPPNSMGTSHMLTMHLQLLQEQYLQHQEYQIRADLSKNECFQRLTPAERESIVNRKVQMLVLPEYLSSFSGLSNSIATLNINASNELYEAITEQAKKDPEHQLFPGNSDLQQQRQAGRFLEGDDFILNAQLIHQQSQQSAHQDHVQHFTGDSAGSFGQAESNKLVHRGDDLSGTDLLNEFNLRVLLRGANSTQQPQTKPNTCNFMTESQLLAARNLMMPMWLPQQQPQSLIVTQHQQNMQPWGPSQIPLAALQTKVASGTLWDVATLAEEQSQQLLSPHENKNQLSFDGVQPNDNFHLQKELPFVMQTQQQAHNQNMITETDHVNSVSTKDSNSKPCAKPAQKQHIHTKHAEFKLNDDERRREQTEEKRRVKEERKKQQLEDEKKRALQAEEEKFHQMQEEKERQQQIQAQRRKALLGNAPVAVGISSPTNKLNAKVDQQSGRSQSTSIAPWSLPASSAKGSGPSLAEIQKAERRERRADQQRQQEQLDKQLRASAVAAAEASDALLKWQASPSPVPIISLADIQAEEAKRLANELLEQQRRRENEQHQHVALAASLGVSGGLSNIWGNSNKAWSAALTSPAAPGVWDESSKNVGQTGLSAAVLSGNLHSSVKKVQSHSKATVPSTMRNLRKSQTVPAMPNILMKSSKALSSPSPQQDKNKSVSSKTVKAGTGIDDKKACSKSQQNDVATNRKINEFENEFTNWCMKSLINMSAKVDVPTFVTFLQDLEAPYEVKDYVRIYLGDGKESTDFAKQFLERRSKYKSLQRAQNAHNDDMCKPAPAITPSGNENVDNKNKQKKVKKNKMTKMDARILGFSVTAAEGRINVGVRDYGDGP